jgi:hypothetical protein
MADSDERALIVGTISDMDDSVDDLEMRVAAMIEELKARRERRDAWKRKLAQLDGTPLPHHGRRKRGENLRMIKACLEESEEGLTASEVKTKTGLAWSSVQRVLSKYPQTFVEVDGLWKLIRRTPKIGSLNGIVKESEA